MGNTTHQHLYQFEQQFDVLKSQGNLYQLQKLNQSTKYIGRKLQSSDEQQIQQYKSIIEAKLHNPSPYLTKLHRHQLTTQDQSPCFKPWNYFYLLFQKHEYTLKQEIERRIHNRIGFTEKQINNMLYNVSKGIQYLYSIDHEHCKIDTSAILWPKQVQSNIKLVDPWALADYDNQYRQEYITGFTQTQEFKPKQALDLYRLGTTTLQMIYMGKHKNPTKNQVQQLIAKINNANIKNKLQIICNGHPESRLKIYRAFQQNKTVLKNRQQQQKRQYIPYPRQHTIVNHTYFNSQYPKNNQSTPVKLLGTKHPSPINQTILSNSIRKSQSHMPISNKLQPISNKLQPIQTKVAQNSSPYKYSSYRPPSPPKNFPSYSSSSANTFSFGNNSNIKSYDGSNIYTSPDFFKKINSSSTPANYPIFSSTNQVMTYNQTKNISNSVSPLYNYSTQHKSNGKISNTQSDNLQKNLHEKTSKTSLKQQSRNQLEAIIKQQNHTIEISNNDNQEEEQVRKSTDNIGQKQKDPTSLQVLTPTKDKIKITTIPQLSQSANSNKSINNDQQKQYVYEEYENGSKYQGYKSKLTGAKTGKGKFFYKEGSFYDGQWKDNNMHGYGKLFYSNSKPAYEGQWYFDRFHGKGKVYNDQPVPFSTPFDYTNFDNLEEQWDYYEGTLVSDEKQGQGKLMLSNGQYFEGEFQKDRVHGQGKFYTLTGDVIKGMWNDSLLVKRY